MKHFFHKECEETKQFHVVTDYIVSLEMVYHISYQKLLLSHTV